MRQLGAVASLDAPAWRCRISLSLSLSSRALSPGRLIDRIEPRTARGSVSRAPRARVSAVVFIRRRGPCARGGFVLPGVGSAWCRFFTGGDGLMSARRSVSLVLVWLCAVAGGLLLWSAPALAQRLHEFSKSFGSEGSGDGQLSRPGAAGGERRNRRCVCDRPGQRARGDLQLDGCLCRAVQRQRVCRAGCSRGPIPG